jgi:3-deoxy-D-manno-octulosonate 8-phosphate phosphatase (KDO 8-P phosphatase)
MIRVLALDIDGVLTDGKVWMDESGRELKSFSYRDIDAVFDARRRGLQVILVTGESSPWVDAVARRMGIERVYRGAKDKYQMLGRICEDLGVSLEQICFVGDSVRDAGALAAAGLGLAPADAMPEARAAASRILHMRSGEGAVAEAVQIVLQMLWPA